MRKRLPAAGVVASGRSRRCSWRATGPAPGRRPAGRWRRRAEWRGSWPRRYFRPDRRWYARAVLRSIRKRRAARKERKLREYAAEYGHMDPAELQELRDQQSPLKAKWGFFPK